MAPTVTPKTPGVWYGSMKFTWMPGLVDTATYGGTPSNTKKVPVPLPHVWLSGPTKLNEVGMVVSAPLLVTVLPAIV